MIGGEKLDNLESEYFKIVDIHVHYGNHDPFYELNLNFKNSDYLSYETIQHLKSDYDVQRGTYTHLTVKFSLKGTIKRRELAMAIATKLDEKMKNLH